MAGYPWTQAELDILEVMAKAGKTKYDVMKVLGRTEDAVMSMASKSKLSLAGKRPEIDMDEYARVMKGETKCL